jgi:hypothetical protein
VRLRSSQLSSLAMLPDVPFPAFGAEGGATRTLS